MRSRRVARGGRASAAAAGLVARRRWLPQLHGRRATGNYYSAACRSGTAVRSFPTRMRACYIFDDLGVSPALGQQVQRGGHRDGRRSGAASTEDVSASHRGHRREGDRGAQGGPRRSTTCSTSSRTTSRRSCDDMSQLLDMVGRARTTPILIGGDEPATFNTEGEDMLGEALPPRSATSATSRSSTRCSGRSATSASA